MNYRRLKATLIFMAILVVMVMIQSGSGATAYASGLASVSAATDVVAIPTAFSYQGTLRKANGDLANGSFTITLNIYNVVTGGSALHSETFNNVVVRNGNFSVVVGDATAINPTVFNNANLYIGLTVAPDAEMLPRQRLFPVPWAMQAATAQSAISAQSATTATAAATANTLIANATIPGQLTIDRGAATKANGKWPGLLLSSNGDGYGSALQLRNINGNQKWSIFPDPSGSLAIENTNNSQRFLTFNAGAGGWIESNIDLHIDGTTFAANIQGLRIVASNGFNGKCGPDPGAINLLITCNQDVAESFASDQPTEPGDLVVFIPEDRERPAVALSNQPYEGVLVGVVSTNPGLVFDEGKTTLAGDNAKLITAKKTVVAMVGRVPTKFSLENGPIRVGDPLTSSSTPGVAMKATQAGQIIGYAMQSSDSAKGGTLMVWLQVGLYLPPAASDALNNGALNNEAVNNSTRPAAASATTEATVAQLQAQLAAQSAQLAKLSQQVDQLQAAQK